MIMTKDKARELNAMTSGRLAQLESLPSDGLYALTATQDVEEIKKAMEKESVDFVLMGMIVPTHKMSAVCQLLEDEQGLMPSPVVMLKKQEALGSSSLDRRTSYMAPTRPSAESRTAVAPHEQPSIRIKDIEIIPGRHEVKVKSKTVTLTFSEFRILQTLASKPGWVFDRDKIIHAVHGDHYNCTERAVDVQVTGLRKKLGSAGEHIETVRGVGYRFAE